MANTLAMNIHYTPVLHLRHELERKLGHPLRYFQAWNPRGEAHITVITPLEYDTALRGPDPYHPILTMQEIGQIAAQNRIQNSRFNIKGIGSGRKWLNDNWQETYFLIVQSANLLRIRQKIHQAFVSKGGNALAWNPNHYFPHITIGFTWRDLHEADGVIKDAAHSLDQRFPLMIQPPILHVPMVSTMFTNALVILK